MQSSVVCFLYKMLAWIWLWDFIIAEVMEFNQCFTAGYMHPCHPRGSETLFQGEILHLKLHKSILLHC